MSDPNKKNVKKSWVKRLGWGAFLFFLIKGLAWLAVMYFGVSQIGSCNP